MKQLKSWSKKMKNTVMINRDQIFNDTSLAIVYQKCLNAKNMAGYIRVSFNQYFLNEV